MVLKVQRYNAADVAQKSRKNVTNAALALFGVCIVEILTNALSKNYLGALLSVFVLFLPLCGVLGARRRSHALVKLFYVSNGLCGVCYVAGLVVMVAVFMPAVRCVCNPECISTARAGDGSGWGAPGSVVLRNEEDESMAEWCEGISTVGMWCSVLLSAAAAMVHFVSCFYGRMLVKVVATVHHTQAPVGTSPFGVVYPQRATASSTRGGAFPHCLPAHNPFAASPATRSHRMVGFGNTASAPPARPNRLSPLGASASAPTTAAARPVVQQPLAPSAASSLSWSSWFMSSATVAWLHDAIWSDLPPSAHPAPTSPVSPRDMECVTPSLVPMQMPVPVPRSPGPMNAFEDLDDRSLAATAADHERFLAQFGLSEYATSSRQARPTTSTMRRMA